VIHVVAYDLREPNTPLDYTNIIDAIKAFATWCRIEKSVWLIMTDQPAANVRDSLKEHMRPTDVLFVAELKGSWASRNLGESRANWLKSKRFF
jgi:hypothetical protein